MWKEQRNGFRIWIDLSIFRSRGVRARTWVTSYDMPWQVGRTHPSKNSKSPVEVPFFRKRFSPSSRFLEQRPPKTAFGTGTIHGWPDPTLRSEFSLDSRGSSDWTIAAISRLCNKRYSNRSFHENSPNKNNINSKILSLLIRHDPSRWSSWGFGCNGMRRGAVAVNAGRIGRSLKVTNSLTEWFKICTLAAKSVICKDWMCKCGEVLFLQLTSHKEKS